MMKIRQLAALFLVGASTTTLVADTKKTETKNDAEPSHVKTGDLELRSADKTLSLQTLCLDNEGRLLGLVGMHKMMAPAPGKGKSEIHVVVDRKVVDVWKLDFHAQSINAGTDGTVFVAGSGIVARYDSKGKELSRLTLPHIAKALENSEDLKKAAETQIKAQKQSFENSKKLITDRLEVLNKKKPEDLTPTEKTQKQQYERIMESYKVSAQYYDQLSVESVVEQTLSRLKVINAIAASKKDLFIVTGETTGYGYAIWRTSHDFKEAKQIINGISGCCGQMDIQVAGDDLLIAENTKHRFARYNRDGKNIGAYGKRATVSLGQESPADCFGGCCNPMNLRVNAQGTIFTAESEGIIKKYSSEGEFICTVAKSPLSGGCKNVAVAVSKDEKMIFFCDQPGSKVQFLEMAK
ncbi:MAG: hypothetical protein R3B84_14740 [Zavarzinella sp.]